MHGRRRRVQLRERSSHQTSGITPLGKPVCRESSLTSLRHALAVMGSDTRQPGDVVVVPPVPTTPQAIRVEAGLDASPRMSPMSIEKPDAHMDNAWRTRAKVSR
jgi:hypothetical protein